MGRGPAPIKRIHLDAFGNVIPGGLMPGESLSVKGDTWLGPCASTFKTDTSKLQLVVDFKDIIDEQEYSMMYFFDTQTYRASNGPSHSLVHQNGAPPV